MIRATPPHPPSRSHVQTFGGQYLHTDIASMAACYMFGLAKNHGFVDGNNRVGARAAYVFLALNGCEVDFPLGETEALALGIAKGEVTKQQVAEFLSKLLAK
ncbi:MAG: type II toxin-antitoxin system death-on-curing family toxin [Tepidisphaeraceae bacterium]